MKSLREGPSPLLLAIDSVAPAETLAQGYCEPVLATRRRLRSRASHLIRELLRLGHHLSEKPQAQLPEAGVGDVDVEPGQEPVGRIRAARTEQVQVLGHERRALLLELLDQGQDEQLAEGVGVAVERR